MSYFYDIGGEDLSEPTAIQLDWARGTTVDTIIGGPIISTTTETAAGTYELQAEPDQLSVPQGTNDLLVVADPDNLITPADPNKVMAIPIQYVITTLDNDANADEYGAMRTVIGEVNADPITNAPAQVTVAEDIQGGTISLLSASSLH